MTNKGNLQAHLIRKYKMTVLDSCLMTRKKLKNRKQKIRVYVDSCCLVYYAVLVIKCPGTLFVSII